MLNPKSYAVTPGSCVPDFDLAVILGQPLGVILDWLCEGRFEGAFYHHKHRFAGMSPGR